MVAGSVCDVGCCLVVGSSATGSWRPRYGLVSEGICPQARWLDLPAKSGSNPAYVVGRLVGILRIVRNNTVISMLSGGDYILRWPSTLSFRAFPEGVELQIVLGQPRTF